MTPASLTQTEAERRAALVAVDRYDVEIDLTDLMTGTAVRCVSTVTFSCRQPGAATFVDCAADVVRATLNGEDLGAVGADHGRIPLDGLAEHNVLRVETVQTDTTMGAGVHRATDPADGAVYVWMSFEPDAAHHVWACFDQPDLKAPHAFTVTAPTGWTVTSNSGAARTARTDAVERWTFPDTPPLSTYNTVINAGPLHRIRRTAGGYDLGLFCRRSLAGVLERDADELFTVTAQGLGFYAEVFGMPFPQRTYDQVFMPEFGGAMENYGCVTWSDAFLSRSAPTPAERELTAKVLLHEMAHMWFGNVVTMRWWDDLWLNEAFAEFACHWAAVSATAYTDAWASQLAGRKLSAYVADQGPISHPIRQPIQDVTQAQSIFDAITYPKGAAVLAQLMAYVGEPGFVAGMKEYFARHAWGNTTLQDLIDSLAASSGRDLDAWRQGWLETAGTDRLVLEHDGDALVLDGRGPDGPPRPQVLTVGAYRTSDAGLERTARAQVEIQGRRTVVDLPADAELLLVNDEDLTFATTRPARGTKEQLIAAARALPTAVARGVAVATLYDMLVTGEATAAETVRCVTGVLVRETAPAVIEPYLTLACDIAEQWSPDAERAELTASVAEVARHLAADPGRRQAALRAVARTAADLEAVAWLQAEAAGDVDLEWRALVRAATLGADTEAQVERLLARDPDPDATFRAVAVRAARPDAHTKAAVWQTAAVDRAVPIGSVGEVAAAFWRPGQDDLVEPYTHRYLHLLPELARGGLIRAKLFTSCLFPLYGVDAAFLTAATTAAQDAAPVVRATVLEKADVVRRMLRSRGSDAGG